MGQVLRMADQKRAYTLSDRATYLAQRGGLDLAVLCEGDPLLRNPYGVIVVSPAKHPHVRARGGAGGSSSSCCPPRRSGRSRASASTGTVSPCSASTTPTTGSDRGAPARTRNVAIDRPAQEVTGCARSVTGKTTGKPFSISWKDPMAV